MKNFRCAIIGFWANYQIPAFSIEKRGNNSLKHDKSDKTEGSIVFNE